MMYKNGHGFGAGNFFTIDVRPLTHTGEALWCQSVISMSQRVTINGVGYRMEQKLPFELLITRLTPALPV